MADIKITNLPLGTDIADDDELLYIDVSDQTAGPDGTDKRVLVGSLRNIAERNATTEDLIASDLSSLPVGKVVTTVGFYESGDGGGAQWVKTSDTDTPSQTPAQLGDTKFTDISGAVWVSSSEKLSAYGAKFDGVSDDTLVISAMSNGLGFVRVDKPNALLGSNYTLTNDIYFEPKAYITVPTGVELEIQSYVNSSRQWIFRGEGVARLGVTGQHTALPEWYGAFPSQSSGVSDYLQKLSDSIQSGREVLIPFLEGTWYLDKPVTWSRACRVFGAGKRITHFRCLSGLPDGDVFVTGGEGVIFKNIQFSSVDIRTTGRYIWLKDNYCEVDELWYTDGYQGVGLSGSLCKATNVFGWVNSELDNGYVAALLSGGSKGYLDNINYYGGTGNAIYDVVRVEAHFQGKVGLVNGTNASNAITNLIADNEKIDTVMIGKTIGDNAGSLLKMESKGTGQVETVDIENIIGTNTTGNSVEVLKAGSGIMKYITIGNIQADSSAADGVYVEATNGNIDHFTIKGGFSRGNTGDGITLKSCRYFTINALDCVSNGGYGTHIDSGCASFIYTGNKNLFNGLGNLDNNSTSSSNVIDNNIG